MLKDIIFMIETTMSFPIKYLTIRTLSLIPKINLDIVNHSANLGNSRTIGYKSLTNG